LLRNKFTLLGVAAVLVGSSVGLATSASATTTLFNTSAASVQCGSIIAASASIAPPLSSASTGTATIKVKGTLGDCVSTGATVGGNPQEPTIVSGSFSGTLNTTGAPGCAGLLSPSTIAGNLVLKWKVASGQKLDFSSTTLSGGTITGGTFTGPLGNLYGQFTLAGQTFGPKSAFIGGTPSTVAATSEDVGQLGAGCLGAPPGPGIKTIHLALGVAIG